MAAAMEELGVLLTNVNFNEVSSEDLSTNSRDKLLAQLQLLECPFTWQPVNFTDSGTVKDTPVSHIEQKEEEIEESDESQWWSKFIFKLVLCYEYFKKGDLTKSDIIIQAAEKILITCNSEGNSDQFFRSVQEAVFHILYATSAHIEMHRQNFHIVENILAKIKPFDSLDEKSKAGVFGTRAAVLLQYGISGTKQALGLLRKALELDSAQGEWHFLLGKCMSRIRHVEKRGFIPDQEEMKALETAVELTKNASYMIFLAQTYREASHSALVNNRNNMGDLEEPISKLMEQSDKYYKMALEERSNCSQINARCALGFLKFDRPYKNLKLARECINKSLALAPNNPLVNHIAGRICVAEGAFAESIKYFELAAQNGVFGAYMDLLRQKKCLDPTFDPFEDFQNMLDMFKEETYKLEIILQIGSYYMFFKDDILKAAEYWGELIDIDPDLGILKEHRNMFLHYPPPKSIYELLFDEAQLIVQTTEIPELNEACLKIIDMCLEHVPELKDEEPKNLKKTILAYSAPPKKNKYHSSNNLEQWRGGYKQRGRGTSQRGRGGNKWRENGNYSNNATRGRENSNYGNNATRGKYDPNANDGKVAGRADMDKNWRSGPRNPPEKGEGNDKSLDHDKDSLSSFEKWKNS